LRSLKVGGPSVVDCPRMLVYAYLVPFSSIRNLRVQHCCDGRDRLNSVLAVCNDGSNLEQSVAALYVLSGFRRDVDDICALLGCYAASSDNPLPTFRDKVSRPIWMLIRELFLKRRQRKLSPRHILLNKMAYKIGS
jgi:hypothetical protein